MSLVYFQLSGTGNPIISVCFRQALEKRHNFKPRPSYHSKANFKSYFFINLVQFIYFVPKRPTTEQRLSSGRNTFFPKLCQKEIIEICSFNN